jgi:multidrug efflux pump subunit AcrB
MFDKFENWLKKVLSSRPKQLIIITLTLFLFGFSVFAIYDKIVLAKMLPGKNNNTFTVYLDLASGSSINQTATVAKCVVEELQKEKEVLNIETFLGMGSPLDFAGLIKGSNFKNSENVAEIVANITNKHHREEPSYLMIQRLRPVIVSKCENIFPDTSIKFVEPPAGPPTLSAIVAEIYGNRAEGVRALAERVKSVFTKIDGLVDIDIMQDEIYDKIEIEVDTIKISKSGLNIKQVNDILYLAFEGMDIAVKNSSKFDEQIPIFLTLQPKDKILTSQDKKEVEMKLASLKLMNVKGMMVPVNEVVNVKTVKSNPMIMTKDLHLMTNVLAETDMVSQVYPLLEARSIIMDTFTDQFDIDTDFLNLKLTDKKTGEIYLLKWDGEMKVSLDTFRDLGGAFIAALILIFLLMVVYYESFALSAIVLWGSMLSFIGVVLGHWFVDVVIVGAQETFFLTATSLIGFIALIGISSRNSLLLIDFTKALMIEKGMEKLDAVAFATKTRAKPIFLTAIAIILASTLLATDAVFGGLGVALIFGTISAVIASIVVIPIHIYNSKDLDIK